MSLSRDAFATALEFAARAPSAHNIQPARWRLAGERIELHEDSARWLAHGDPTGRDNQIALGMAWESLCLGLSSQGYATSPPAVTRLTYPPEGPSLRLAAVARVEVGGGADELSAQVMRRSCWRGTFRSASAAELTRLDACIAKHADVTTSASPGLLPNIARWYDAAAVQSLRTPALAQELYHWMRFTNAHSRQSQDGLSAECLGLSHLEAWAASYALRPAVLRWLDRFSLLGSLANEASKVNSAARIVLIHAPAATSDFDAGRAWLRFWLELTGLGFAGVPMSALGDSPEHRALLLEAQPIPPGRRLVNLMRVGPAPDAGAARSARRTLRELWLD